MGTHTIRSQIEIHAKPPEITPLELAPIPHPTYQLGATSTQIKLDMVHTPHPSPRQETI